MNGLIVLAACACAASGQVYAPGLAIPAAAPSHQFHAQDEFGQFSFGYAGGPSAKTEARNAYGVTTGSYQYVDANGLLQTVNYIADDVNGFRVQGTNLPVGPVSGLAAPVFEGVQAPAPVFAGVQIADTQEVIDAKAAFAAAYAAQEAAVAEAPAAERKRREAQLPIAAGLPLTYAGYNHGLLSPLAFAAPGAIVANIAHATPEVVSPAAVTYAGLGLAAPIAPLAVAAAPSREAVLTTIKLNPGHAVSYRVD